MTTTTEPAQLHRQKPKSSQIPAGVGFVGSEFRSTNLERDVRETSLHSPYVGVRALDILGRVSGALGDLRRTRAWSFTGPYGSGKSTLSNIIDALLGHDTGRQAEAQRAIEETSPTLAAQLVANRKALAPDGFLGAVTTARREPLATTVHRALQTAIERKWHKRRPPKSVAAAMRSCAKTEVPTTDDLLAAVSALCTEAPLLLIIDEFGKTLEHLASSGDSSSTESDVFLLQLLAEQGAGRSGLRLFTFTLQHLAFTDYASRSSAIQTQEWAKVQGRFEDVTFTPNLGDAIYLLESRLDHSAVSRSGKKLIEAQARDAANAWREHSLNAVADLSAQSCAGLYPLHPLTAVAAPLMAAQIGQNDRSLSGFLASDEPHTVRRSIDDLASDAPVQATTVRLPQLYDYFFDSGRTTILASASASRWLEIDARLSEAHGLPDEDQDILKAIGVLNLIDADGLLRATPAMIQFALNDPTDASDPKRYSTLERRLEKLVDGGLVVHRSYSNEYRIWQGTDVDIDARVREIATLLKPADVIRYFNQHLGTTVLPNAVTAGAHSQRTGMQRHFVTAVSHQTEKLDGPETVRDAADGLLVFHLGDLDSRPLVQSALPALIGVTEDPASVLEAGTTLVALQDLLGEDLDHVAKREIAERAADLRQNITALLSDAFRPGSGKSRWHLWHKGTETTTEPSKPLTARSYASLASLACDAVYPDTPHVRNEMVGRHQLTSNAARARRELLTAMIKTSGLPRLGYEEDNFTPERALYSGVLEYLGLHRADGSTQSGRTADGSILTHGIARPAKDANASVLAVWEALEDALSNAKQPTPIVDIYHQLMAPPYGVKAGVVPILITAALILRGDDVALFEEGNYCPRLAPEIVERLNVPYPDRFTVKSVPVGRGQRRLILDGLTKSLNVDLPRSRTARNPALLAVTRGILERVMTLQPYAKKTRRLSSDALAIREVLARATDPDDLVFTTLPKALDYEPILPSTRRDEDTAGAYVASLTSALEELTGAGAALRQSVISTLADEFRLPDNLRDLRTGLQERLLGFVDVSLEASLHGFVTRAVNTTLPDEDWLDPIVIQLVNKALGDWTDHDVDNFPRVVRDKARALDRVSHLFAVEQPPRRGTASGTDSPQLETHLLTLTTPRGTEERTLIHVPSQSRQAADELVVSVIRQAEETLGRDGARILLAALVERLSAPKDPTAEKKEGTL